MATIRQGIKFYKKSKQLQGPCEQTEQNAYRITPMLTIKTEVKTLFTPPGLISCLQCATLAIVVVHFH